MFKKISLPFLAFLQTSGLVIYIICVVSFISFIAPHLENKTIPENIFAPLIMLLLFVISAIISATLVLGRAAVLFWEKLYKECFTIILWTIIWGLLYFSIIVSFLYFSF